SADYRLARRIECREHFRRLYSSMPADKKGQVLKTGKKLVEAAIKQFGASKIRYDQYIAKESAAPNFPVLRYDGTIVSSLRLSSLLSKLPGIAIETVYCDESILEEARTWRDKKVKALLKQNKSKKRKKPR